MEGGGLSRWGLPSFVASHPEFGGQGGWVGILWIWMDSDDDVPGGFFAFPFVLVSLLSNS